MATLFACDERLEGAVRLNMTYVIEQIGKLIRIVAEVQRRARRHDEHLMLAGRFTSHNLGGQGPQYLDSSVSMRTGVFIRHSAIESKF